MLPGIVGTLQACEAIKVLLGLGDDLSGRLLTFDTLSMDFRPMRIYQDPECSVCADRKGTSTEASTEAPAAAPA